MLNSGIQGCRPNRTRQLQSGSVGSMQIRVAAIETARIQDAAISKAKIGEAAVGGAQIAALISTRTDAQQFIDSLRCQ